MFNLFFTGILLLFWVCADVSFAQGQNDWASKTYSGHWHQAKTRNMASMWQALFSKRNAQLKEDASAKICSIEFKSPVSFLHEMIGQLPEELTYHVRFKNGTLKKFIIKIYTNDDEEYTLDPDAEGNQIGINDEHHIFDTYLIYLILGQDINHLEVADPQGNDQDKYILDKLEIHNDD
jgi:hypothetical protein